MTETSTVQKVIHSRPASKALLLCHASIYPTALPRFITFSHTPLRNRSLSNTIHTHTWFPERNLPRGLTTISKFRNMSHHHQHHARSRQPIQIESTDQGPRVGPYIFGRTLGTGSTGKVKLAKNLVTGEIVAIKIVRKDYLENKPSLKKKMRREISVLKLLSHPNLMSLIDVIEIDTHLFLVMEFVDGLELFEYLVRRGALPMPEALAFFQQIICGLEYCHNRLICHRDLKPENLLLDRQFNIKIADFGMTSLNPPGSLLATSCGSPHYCDPMVVSGEKYDGLKADIWSCGVILYAMVTGRLPFDDDNIQRLLQKVQAGQYHLPSDLPEDLRDLIKSMLTVDPSQRITLQGIKDHRWFKSIPPRNYIDDKFVAPSAPVLNPSPFILGSLTDLGWGDMKTITAELAKEGPSMEKVFYQQLERHPMFKHGEDYEDGALEARADGKRSQPTEDAPTDKSNAKISADANQTETLQQKLAAVKVSNGAEPHGDTESPETEASPGSGETRQGAQLVRQSSIARMGPDGQPRESNADEGAEEAIQSASGGQQRSWFDSFRAEVRNYLTGHPDGERTENNEGKQEKGP